MAEICNGLVSIGDWEVECSSDVGISGRGGVYSPMGRRRPTFKSMPKSRIPMFEEDGELEKDAYHLNFLESCFLCKRHLGGSCDLFMYKGEMAFCSEECREEYMEMDEAKERSLRKLALKASRKTKSAATNGVRAAGTVVA